MTTQKSIKLKNGSTLPAGLPVTFSKDSPRICFVHHDSRPDHAYQVRCTSAFQSPGMEAIEESCADGVCESVMGENVEPDGWDSHGSPSWLLALGMI